MAKAQQPLLRFRIRNKDRRHRPQGHYNAPRQGPALPSAACQITHNVVPTSCLLWTLLLPTPFGSLLQQAPSFPPNRVRPMPPTCQTPLPPGEQFWENAVALGGRRTNRKSIPQKIGSNGSEAASRSTHGRPKVSKTSQNGAKIAPNVARKSTNCRISRKM